MSNSPIPLKEFRLDLSELTYTGHDLVRPESILAKVASVESQTF